MKEVLKIILTIVATTLLVYYIMEKKYSGRIETMESKYEEVVLNNSLLREKVKSADEIYETLKKRENYLNIRVKKSKQELSEQDQLIDDLIKIKDNYELEKERLDSLKSNGPNRDKEQLINSLKLKTNI